MSAEQTERDHPSAGVLAAFVDGTLPLAERAAIDSHLADCDDCRADVIAAVRFARPRVTSFSSRVTMYDGHIVPSSFFRQAPTPLHISMARPKPPYSE